MSFDLELTDEVIIDIERHKKSGEKKLLIKIDKLFDELREHPTFGTGKPEKLRPYEVPTWLRRISGKPRLICRIQDKKVTVLILSVWGHYDDK